MQGMRGRRPYFAEELPTPGKAHSKLLQLLRDQTWSAEPDMECSPIPGDDVRASAAHAVEPLRAVGLLESVQFAAHVGVFMHSFSTSSSVEMWVQPSRHQGPTRRRFATVSSSTRVVRPSLRLWLLLLPHGCGIIPSLVHRRFFCCGNKNRHCLEMHTPRNGNSDWLSFFQPACPIIGEPPSLVKTWTQIVARKILCTTSSKSPRTVEFKDCFAELSHQG